jgi:hypothetical protein
MIPIFPLWTFHLYVATFLQHLHMKYISLRWYDIPEVLVPIRISLIEVAAVSTTEWCMHACGVSNLLFTNSTSKGNFTYLYLTDFDKLLQSVLQTPYTATRVKNLIEFGVITRNPKTLFKDNLPRKNLTVHLPPCCTLPVKCKQCQPVNILLAYWC